MFLIYINCFCKQLSNLSSSDEYKHEVGIEYNNFPPFYTDTQVSEELKNILSREELLLIEGPLKVNKEIEDYVRTITKEAKTEIDKAKAIYHALIDTDKLNITHTLRQTEYEEIFNSDFGYKTAIELFTQKNQKGKRTAFCGEYTNLYLAMSKIVGLKAFTVGVLRDFQGYYVSHICAGIKINNRIVLVDPSYNIFDATHLSFDVYDYLGTIALHHVGKGAILLYQDKIKEAEDNFNLAKKITPNLPNVHNSFGVVYMRKGEYAKAIEAFNRVLEAEPDFIESRFHLASVYRTKGLYLKAANELQECLKYKLATDSVNKLETIMYQWQQLDKLTLQFKDEFLAKNIKNLKDKDANVRRSAVRALGNATDISLAPLLIEALDDENSNVRYFAADSLHELTQQSFGFDPEATKEIRKKVIKDWWNWWRESSRSKQDGG